MAHSFVQLVLTAREKNKKNKKKQSLALNCSQLAKYQKRQNKMSS